MATEASGHRAAIAALLIGHVCILGNCRRSESPDAIQQRARFLLRQGNLKEALVAADAGFRREPSWRFRLLKAEILISSGKAPEAMEILRGGELPATPDLQARLMMHRGMAKILQSDYAGAGDDLDRARQLAQPLHDALLDAEIDLRLGGLQIRKSDLPSADASLRRTLSTATSVGDPYLEAAATGNLGVMFLNSFRYDEAIYWLDRAREAFIQLGSVSSIARASGNLGWCYYRLGDHDKALVHLREAKEGFEKLGNRYEQQIWLGNIGSVMIDRGDFNAALEQTEQALRIAREVKDQYWMAAWLDNLALASIRLGRYDAAEIYNRQALDLKQNLGSRSVSYPRVNEALIAAGRGQFAPAERLYRAILAEPSDDPTPVLEAESGLAELLVQLKQYDRADGQFRAAIALVEGRRSNLTRDEYKLSYLSSLIDFYQRYVDFLVSQGNSERALEVAESSRARVLDERLHSTESARRSITTAGLQQFARSSHSVLLSYWLAPTRSFLWVVTPDEVQLHVLPPEKEIGGLVEAYRTFIENLRDPLDSEFPAGKKLSEILLGPVKASQTRIIVVPDRALHSLNLETLPDPQNPAHYLIDRVTVAVAPSLGVLLQARKLSNATRSLLLIGDPEPAVEEYPKLIYASREMNLIARSFAPDRRLVIEGPQAYPAAYRAAAPSRFSWIHFAAHASANRESPLDSALILSRHDAGYALSAREVMEVALNADLVTLSACRSAGSKTYSGEGLVGLSWAFLRAGAKNVVAGLWDVTDMSTANLMAEFYEQLVKNVAPAEALRAAKLRLIQSPGPYRKPFYWGPFQLYAGTGL